MGALRFHIYFCGMSQETFTKQIMIYKSNSSIVKAFTTAVLQQLAVARVGELIDHLKTDLSIRESLGIWGLNHFSVSTVYVRHRYYLVGLREDKFISDIFRDLNTNDLELVHFVVGGASLHNETSYRFIVHPNEKTHAHMPHVHVSKAGVEIRYSLETLLPIDPLVAPHKRDNKKVITPFLQNNCEQLLEMWRLYTKGYTTPEITQEGQQFYKES